jgi:hypothetical protein
MRTHVLAVIGVLILAGVAGWAGFGLGKMHSVTPAGMQADILQAMSAAKKDLPNPRYDLF